MWKKFSLGWLLLAPVVCASAIWLWAQDEGTPTERRTAASRDFDNGNYKEALERFRKLTLDPKNDVVLVGKDLEMGVNALRKLGRIDEVDDFREKTIEVHKDNWRLLAAAAQSYLTDVHHGFIVGGKFSRGNQRGGNARYVNSYPRDWTRAMQLMNQALAQVKDEKNSGQLAEFYLDFARHLLQGMGGNNAWRLQVLTDLTKLPDYEEGYRGYSNSNHTGAPVDADGKPIYHTLPKSWEAAESDGQRWRWLLMQAAETDRTRLSESEMILGNFMWQQIGEQTMARYGRGDEPSDTGTYAVSTLKENETIARLAIGVKRFDMPDEFNWIKIFQRVADREKGLQAERALEGLASTFENRRQYPKAAKMWERAIREYGPGVNGARQNRLDQIVKNWARFEPTSMQAEDKGAVVDLRFRNANKIAFEAYEIKVPELLADVKAYIESKPGRLDWQRAQVQDVGYLLVEKQQLKYQGAKVANWELTLKPKPDHVDARVTVATPLQNPGAYLLLGQTEGGNTARIVVWINDTVLFKKQLDSQAMYGVVDAMTGTPVPAVDLEFFGWKSVQIKPNTNDFRVETKKFEAKTDADGAVYLGNDKLSELNHHWNWIVSTRADAKRFAYLGFNHYWYGRGYDPEYNQTRVFTITDRPVYRPDQNVQFKFWVRHAKYDQADDSSFAGKELKVEIFNPRHEKIFEKLMTADAFGGLAGEFYLAKGCMLGQYTLSVFNHGGGAFRVEEYKKPEFEVTVDAPKEPVRLGDQISASVSAKYYFGAPVTKALAKIKILRTTYSPTWFPRGEWDWFYNPGYWWFAPNYDWYPGFRDWGVRRPHPWWIGQHHQQPELISEIEVPVGPDGKIDVPIDTLPAKELHGNQDHKYSITAEVVDESRRTIVGTGSVIVARHPFKIYTWLDRGFHRVGDTVKASFSAQTPDNKPVQGKGELTLFRITYDAKQQPIETKEESWALDTNVEGIAKQQIKAHRAGQYRLSYKLTDSKKQTIEGGYVFIIRGEGFDGRDFRFNDLELSSDRKEYQPGDKATILVNANRPDSTVFLFVRPTNGVYLKPRTLRIKGKSAEETVEIVQRDMPNMFVEAMTISEGRIHTEVREVVVPPEKRVLNVDVVADRQEYKPGEKAVVKVKLTDHTGKPFVGTTAISVYDKAVEYISGGSNVAEIKSHFWKWRRHHHTQTFSNLHGFSNIVKSKEKGMNNLGVFGGDIIEEWGAKGEGFGGRAGAAREKSLRQVENESQLAGAPMNGYSGDGKSRGDADAKAAFRDEGGGPALVEPTIRENFADTAFWAATVATDKDGLAEVKFAMPENLTAWKIRVWAMGHGTKVGQGDAEVVTKKDLIVRLQAPRFFVQKDEVVLSANVHNYLKADKTVRVSLEFDGGTLLAMDELKREVVVKAGGEQRVDWRVKVVSEGEAVVRMKAQTDVDADAMQMRFPVYIHGMLKMESYTGVIRSDKNQAQVAFNVPLERRLADSRLEVRYTPTLAGAMVDALPYMVDYPYGCTEQTLNRFLPTVITQKVLQGMKLDLKEIEKHHTNLNSQEIGDDKERQKGWKRFKRNPVFDVAEVERMTQAGVNALVNMQISDGGWGWFSGYGERSYPHTTAVVVHGLQVAKANGVRLPANMLERGMTWLKNYQEEQLVMLRNAATKTKPFRERTVAIDALVYMTLVDGTVKSDDMMNFLYRDRTFLPVYAKAMLGLALQKQNQQEQLTMIMKNIEQYVVMDDENQTAYLKMPQDNPWWTWYGSEIEAHAYYLRLLSSTSPKDEKASRLVKYLLNNRKHATYWNSTRDTAVCIEAFAEYLKATGEDNPDMTLEVWLDGKKKKEVRITRDNLFTFDNKLVLTGDQVTTGKHLLEIRRQGAGPVYFNAYVTNFTLEDFITRAGLEVKVNRKYYKLTRVESKVKVSGSKGQALDQAVEKYDRTELENLATLKSGDLVEVEMVIESKNDYEYVCFEDMKPAGFEPMQIKSGYGGNDMGAYMELRDEKVCFFARTLPRGSHNLRYRMRAEIPGQFSALPTRAFAMYAPELRGNSDEIKLIVRDR